METMLLCVGLASGGAAAIVGVILVGLAARRRRREEASLERDGALLGIERVPGEDIDSYRREVIIERDRRVRAARDKAS